MHSDVNKTILKNGLTVISEFVPGVRSVSAGIWIKAGSRNENAGNMGTAHFLEHMVFKGTKNRSALKIALALEESGGHLNAYTSKEQTVFLAQSLDSEINNTIHVLADLVCNPLLRLRDLKKEKSVILEEILAVKDTPEDYIFDLFQENLFPEQSIGFPILGTKKSILPLKQEDVYNFWQQFYNAKNIVLSVAGNVDHNQLLKLAEKNFVFGSSDQSDTYDSVSSSKNLNIDFPEPVNQCHICMGQEIPGYASSMRHAIIALNTYLGNGMSSRLFQLIREKHGLAYSVFSFLDLFRDAGIFGFYLGTDLKNKEKAVDILHTEIEKLLQSALKKNVVDKIKKQLRGNLLLGLESTQRRMSRNAKNEIYFNKFISANETIAEIDEINSQILLETSQKIFIMDHFNITSILPYA